MMFQKKQAYSFSIYGAAVIPTSFRNCVVLGAEMDASLVRSMGHDIDAQQALILPYLPKNGLTNLDEYTFITVQLSSGIKTAVAVEWIDPSTYEVVTGMGVRITTQRNLTQEDVRRISEFFSMMGLEINMVTI